MKSIKNFKLDTVAMKTLCDAQERYRAGIMKGFSLYGVVPCDMNLLKLDKFIFKNADLMAEYPAKEFPFELIDDCLFTLMSVKDEHIHFLIERESEKTYFVNYISSKFSFQFVISYNEKAKEVISYANFSKELLNLLGIKKEQIIDMAMSSVSKMISIVNDPDSHIAAESGSNVTFRTKNSIKSAGKPVLISTRYKNALHCCDAYPLFFDIDFKAMDEAKNAN